MSIENSNNNENENVDPIIEYSICNRTRFDSGYLTLTSPCLTSPSRLSPIAIRLEQIDSPYSEYDIQSPVSLIRKNFQSNIDYEQYLMTRKYFDILTQLNHRNATHIIDLILANLSRIDLNSCLIVCRKWSKLIQDYFQRNHCSIEKQPSNIIKEKKQPMQTVTNLLDMNLSISNEDKFHEQNVHLTASTMTYRYRYLKDLHGPTVTKRCPLCAYVSIVDVNDQHGVCTNPLCRNNFCRCCSGPYHPSSPCKPTTGPIKSPWRQRPSISPIFSNKTRVNLRRLLI